MAEILKPGVLFKKGSISQLQTLINGKKGKDGVFYLAEDEQNLYFGTSTGEIKRIQGNVKFYLSLQDFQNNEQPPYSTDLIYFIADNNALVRWDGAKWVQLNATADSVNSAIADITDAIGALEDSVSANAGNIAQNAADIALKASQADLLALDGEVDALAVRVTNTETTIGQHTTAISKKAEQTALDATNQSVVANAEAIKDLQDNAKELATNKDLTALAERVTTAEGTIADHTTLIGQKADKSVVESISSDLEAAKASIVSNNEKITANTKNINDYKESNNARVLAVENRVATNENDIANLKDTKVNNGKK